MYNVDVVSHRDMEMLEDDIFPDVQRCIKKNTREVNGKKHVPNFTVNNVFECIKNRSAIMYRVSEKETGKYAGYICVASEQDGHNELKNALIWHCYSKAPGVVDAVLPIVEEHMRRLGYKKMIFYTTRKGWERTAPKLGYNKVAVTYAKEI